MREEPVFVCRFMQTVYSWLGVGKTLPNDISLRQEELMNALKKYGWIALVSLLLLIGVLFVKEPYSVGQFVANYFAAGDFVLGVFAAGTFSAGIFAAGTFAVGLFSIGIFSLGIFSIGLFSIGLYGLGFFVIAKYRNTLSSKEGENRVR
jgi:hypothetical protein